MIGLTDQPSFSLISLITSNTSEKTRALGKPCPLTKSKKLKKFKIFPYSFRDSPRSNPREELSLGRKWAIENLRNKIKVDEGEKCR